MENLEIPLYNVLEETTMGLTIIAENLTKEQTQAKFDELTNDGVSPERIKIQRVS
tara:strand:+ start:4194 stop:4358 length:165 start_codon:yes stop_codon:yes gene_type:complete